MAFQRTNNSCNQQQARGNAAISKPATTVSSDVKVHPKYRLRMASLGPDGKVAKDAEFIQVCNLFEQIKDDGSVHYSGKSEDGTTKFFLMTWNPKKEG